MNQPLNEVSKLIKKLANDKYTFYRDINNELTPGGIILLGDSLVENFPIAEMYIGSKRVLNRGIFGSTTYDIINQLDGLVNVLKPDKVIIWLGTNDFMPFIPNNTEVEIANRVIEIADIIKTQKYDTEILIVSLMPINQSSHPKIYHEWLVGKNNDKLRNTNIELQNRCIEKNYNFLDLYNLFTDKDGQLQLNYTIDGTHINFSAYKIVFEKLKPYL